MRDAALQNLLRGLSLLVLGASVVACGDDKPPTGGETTDPPASDLEDEPALDGAPENAGIQSWGVGAKWYDYDGSTHAVSPSKEAWYLVRDDATWHLSITRYYNDDGISGHPNMVVNKWDAGSSSWTRVGEWLASEKVQAQRQCFRLDDPENPKKGDECNSFEYDVIWRSDFRAVPAAGFSIGNPAFYIATDKGGEVFNVQNKALPSNLDVLSTSAAVRILSIFDHDAVSIIESRFFTQVEDHTNTIVSLTGDKLGAQWRLDEEGDEVTVTSRCVDINTTNPAAAPTFDGDSATLSFDIGESANEWTLVDLCGEEGPSVFQTLTSLRPGNWPSNDKFDLAFQKSDDGYVIWMAPEQIMIPVREGNWGSIQMHPVFWSN